MFTNWASKIRSIPLNQGNKSWICENTLHYTAKVRLQGVILRQNIWEILDTKYATFSWKKFLVHHSYYSGFKQFRELPLSVLLKTAEVRLACKQTFVLIWMITLYIFSTYFTVKLTFYWNSWGWLVNKHSFDINLPKFSP